MCKGLYLFMDLSFGITLKLMLDRHHLCHLKEKNQERIVNSICYWHLEFGIYHFNL